MTLAKGKFDVAPANSETTRLEASLSFITVQNLYATNDVIRQIKAEICLNRKKLVETWLSTIASGEHPYTVEQLFGRGHLAIRSGAAVYISKCKDTEVIVRNNDLVNCTAEIPVMHNNKSVFVDPITFILQSYGTNQICNNVAPPRYKIAGQWFCAKPTLEICPDPEQVPVGGVKVDELSFKALHFGESMYSNDQLEQFSKLKESAHARKAYLADLSHQATEGKSEGEWGLGLGGNAISNLLDTLGNNFIPYYRFFGRPALSIMWVLFLLGMLNFVVSFAVRAFYIAKEKGCGLWLIFGFCNTLFYIIMAPARAAQSSINAAVTEAIGEPREQEERSVQYHSQSQGQQAQQHQHPKIYPDVNIV